MSQTWRALTLSEGCGQILRLWPTEKLQNATVGTKYPPFCLRFTLPVPGFYILISRLLDTRRKLESLAYSQPFTLQTQLATRSSADRSSESFKIRSIRSP